jgi:hypothetical protein
MAELWSFLCSHPFEIPVAGTPVVTLSSFSPNPWAPGSVTAEQSAAPRTEVAT